ncbi:MAG: hypothetical protein Q9167_005952 [Letrouitia subvulpina]
MELLLFGDQTDDYRATFHQLFLVKSNPLLTAFLDESATVLRCEISQQPHSLQTKYPGFTSIADLIARYSESSGPRLNGLESALTCAIPSSNQAYVSAVVPAAVTVSGPSSILDRLFQFGMFESSKAVRIPIYGPFHWHLQDDSEIQSVFKPSIAQNLLSTRQNFPVLSTGRNEWLVASTFEEILQQVVADVLRNKLLWHHAAENIGSTVSELGFQNCDIVRLGPSNASQSLITALKQSNIATSTIDALIPQTEDPRINLSAGTNFSHSKIAICGLSGRFPDAADYEAFWILLEKGLDLHREIPKDRFNVDSHFDPAGKRVNTTHTPFGCFIKEPGLFDPRFFNISPREAAQIDPMQRLALVTAYEALEMSGFVENRTVSSRLDRVGTFYGQTSDDWREIQAAQKVDTYFIPGNVRAFVPGRINFVFNFSGPSFNVDTACSSSLAAINVACNSLWTGDCDTAIAGGVNVLTNPDIFSGLSRGQFLSKKGPCATFDNDADGYCRADSVGSVVLKRLEDAMTDKDPILGVIAGVGTNHSAEATSITHPHAGAQEFLYKQVLTAANVDPLDVSYLELHGTGTQAGDATEMESVTNVFAPIDRTRDADQSLHLGSVKANAGHSEAASGVTAIIKVLLMMQKGQIPPHCGIKGSINRNFPKDLQERNVHIAFEPKSWQRPKHGKRRAVVNNFSAAGGNTALILEDAPEPSIVDTRDSRPIHIIPVTARSNTSLKRNLQSLCEFLEECPDVDLPNLSYTTSARRMQHKYRATIAGSNISKIKDSLLSASRRDHAPSKARIAFVFTGQGCHYASMGKQLLEISATFRSKINQFDAIARQQEFPSILPLIDGTVDDIQTLSTVVVQVGSVCVQMALLCLLRSWGIHPTVVLGHSLGEYAALNAAGVLSPSDTIYLVGLRAQLLEAKCHPSTHAMLAVNASLASIREFLDGSSLEVACLNSPEATVLSGTGIDVGLISQSLKDQGFKCTKLQVPYAFHSAQVVPILRDFEEGARAVTFNSPTTPVISPLLCQVVTSDEKTFGPSYLKRHCRETVDFLGGIESAKHANIITDDTFFVELGCHPVLSEMIRATLSKARTAALMRRNDDNWKTITSSLCQMHDAGINIDWSSYHDEYLSCQRTISLPAYQWDNKNYWIDYTNDWTLTKGDRQVEAEVASTKPQFSSASIHGIIEAHLEGDKPTILTESDLTDPSLKEVIDGHEVNGVGLCPPSLYADMALTIADYVLKNRPTKGFDIGLNACDMKVEKPLIADDSKSSQMLRIAGEMDISADKIYFTIYSVDEEGRKTITHATCAVKYEDKSKWITGWDRVVHLIKPRIDDLLAGVENGDNDLLKRGMVYKLFGGLINYGFKYRGIEEVALSNAQLEAASTVRFQTGGTDENLFFCSPYRLDSIAHISGFIMLGNQFANPSKEVYVSHGWESCRVATPLVLDKTYQAYVKMQKESAKTAIGDVYVWDQDRIIAVVEGLEFHALPRQLMDTILAAANPKKKTKKKPASDEKANASRPASASKTLKNASEGLVQQKSPENTLDEESSSTTSSQLTSEEEASSESSSTSEDIQPIESQDGDQQDIVRSMIASEIGVAIEEIDDSTELTSLGMDSLLSLTILGKIREVTGKDLPSDFLAQKSTLGSIQKGLGFGAQQEKVGTQPPADSDAQEVTALNASEHHGGQLEKSPTSLPKASSVLLQGNPQTATMKLFLFPNGSGSATSYTSIPAIANFAIYALNSPFMTSPSDFTVGISGIASLYLEEIKRRQPRGPYFLGGWSAGGVAAYETALQLQSQGHGVERLVLIDAPCPLDLPVLPPTLHAFFDDIGILGNERGTPEWLLPHFDASVRNLSSYKPKRMEAASPPKVFLLWASDGVLCGKYSRPPIPHESEGPASWLLDNRGGDQLKFNGWDQLFGKNIIIETDVVKGVNHFSMMKERAPEIGLFLAEAMGI